MEDDGLPSSGSAGMAHEGSHVVDDSEALPAVDTSTTTSYLHSGGLDHPAGEGHGGSEVVAEVMAIQKALEQGVFTVVVLKEAIALRSKLGLRMSFLEDNTVLLFGIEALRKKPRARLQAALVEETQRLLKLSDEDQERRLLTLMGPRGGLPWLKSELIELATLLHTVDPGDTVEVIKMKVKPTVESLKGRTEMDMKKVKEKLKPTYVHAQKGRPATEESKSSNQQRAQVEAVPME